MGLNASGWAPKALTIEFLHKQGIRDMPQHGVHAITVPGAVDGWRALAGKFGRKKLGEDLAAAIRTAEDGFPVPSDGCVLGRGAGPIAHDEAQRKLICRTAVRRGLRRISQCGFSRVVAADRGHGARRFIRERSHRKFWRR